jgi:hypothetical protein
VSVAFRAGGNGSYYLRIIALAGCSGKNDYRLIFKESSIESHEVTRIYLSITPEFPESNTFLAAV